MKKIIIGIKNDFVRRAYSEVFENAGFEVLESENGEKILNWTMTENPDIVFADISLENINGYEILKKIRDIPVVIFASAERKDEKEKAIDLNAKDFISIDRIPPKEILSRVKIALGEQKSYKFSFSEELFSAKEMLRDFGYSSASCKHCGGNMILNLIKDLSVGDDYYKVSFFCSKCFKK